MTPEQLAIKNVGKQVWTEPAIEILQNITNS